MSDNDKEIEFLVGRGWRVSLQEGFVTREHPNGKIETIPTSEALSRERNSFIDFISNKFGCEPL